MDTALLVQEEEDVVRKALAALGDGAQTPAGDPWRAAASPSSVREAIRGLRRALLRHNYTEVTAKLLLGPKRLAAQGAWPRLSVKVEEITRQFASAQLPTATLALLGTFLLNVSFPRHDFEAALGSEGKSVAMELESIGILWRREIDGFERWQSAVQIAPVQAAAGSTGTLFFFVDWDKLRPWHQVMTVTIDSYALLQAQKLAQPTRSFRRILDLCSGSGVQGLHAAALGVSKGLHTSVSLVDLNPRALRFAKANIVLNSLRRVTLHAGSLYDALPQPCFDIACNSSAAQFDLILANPPYVPSSGGGQLFVAGGPTGEAVTEAIVRGSSAVLAEGGWLMLVANLANPHHGFLDKVRRWWHSRHVNNIGNVVVSSLHGDIWTATEYAGGFIGSDDARSQYRAHLREAGVASMTNGFIFIRRPVEKENLAAAVARSTQNSKECSGDILRQTPGLWHALVDTSHDKHQDTLQLVTTLLNESYLDSELGPRRRCRYRCPCRRCVCFRTDESDQNGVNR